MESLDTETRTQPKYQVINASKSSEGTNSVPLLAAVTESRVAEIKMYEERIKSALSETVSEIEKIDFAKSEFCAQKNSRAGELQGKLAQLKTFLDHLQTHFKSILTESTEPSVILQDAVDQLKLLKMSTLLEASKLLCAQFYDELEVLSLQQLDELGFSSFEELHTYADAYKRRDFVLIANLDTELERKDKLRYAKGGEYEAYSQLSDRMNTLLEEIRTKADTDKLTEHALSLLNIMTDKINMTISHAQALSAPASDPEQQPKATLIGGMPGSGKSRVYRQRFEESESPAAPTDTNPEPRIMDKEEISTSLTDVDNFATGYNQTAKANELPKPD